MEPREKRQRGRPRAFDGAESAAPIQSLERALRVLRLVGEADGLSLSEVASIADLPPSTAYRILTTLQRWGMVDFDESGQLWYIGVETFRMGAAFLRRRKLAERARTVMQDLMTRCGETANLAVAEEGCVVFVSQVETHEAIRAFFRPGTRSPYHASGIGKAILAYLDEEQLARVIERSVLQAFTKKTRSTETRLRADLARIRRRGWSLDDEERFAGMRCVAAPIFNEFGEPVGGVSVSGPSVRVTSAKAREFGPLVRAAGEQITREIGGTVPG